MMLTQLADKYIPVPKNKKELIKPDGVTRDIIKEVLDCYQAEKEQLQKFATFLKGSNVLETGYNIWNFWKSNIRYQVDVENEQWVKTPAAVWASKFCDCKSFSVAVASTLHCLGIDGKFRFTSYGNNDEIPTHVYVVAVVAGKEIIIDCVWTGFNSEKPYTKKWDYNMTKIFRLSGIDNSPRLRVATSKPKRYAVGQLNVDLNDEGLTEAEFDLGLTIQGLELEQGIMRRTGVFGIGAVEDNNYQYLIEGHKIVLRSLHNNRKGIRPLTLEEKLQDPAIGNIFKKIGKGIKKIGKGIKKVAKGVAKGVKNLGKAVTKVIKTPVRMAAAGALKDSGGFFLYLFLNPAIPVNKLPEEVQRKLAKAQEYKQRVIKKLQMPEKNFNNIIRNSVMQNFGNTPENVLAEWIKASTYRSINGIGWVQAAMEFAGPLIEKAKAAFANALSSLFGKLGQDLEADLEAYMPSPQDWGILEASTADAAANSSFALQNGSGSYYGNSGNNLYQPPSNDDNYSYQDRTNSGDTEKEVWQENIDADGNTTGYTNVATGQTLAQPPYYGANGERTEIMPAGVIVKSTKKNEAGGSGLMWLGLGVAAMALSNKK